VSLTGGYYLADGLGLDQRWSPAIAALVLALAVVANLAGVRITSGVQVALALGVAAVLAVAAGSAVPDLDPARLHPFAPHGVGGAGQAVVVLFFAFAGWEAVTHLSGEFRDVGRDLRRATLITLVVVTALYLAVGAAVVLTGTYGDARTDRLAIGLLLQHSLGVGAAAAAGAAALVISLGTTNAFIASVSRLGYALAQDGWLPRTLARISSRSVPAVSVLAVGGIGAAGLAVTALGHWGTEDIVAIPSTLVIMTYVVGMASGVRLLTGHVRAAAALALLLTLAVLPFALAHVLVPAGVTVAALTYRTVAGRRRGSPPPAGAAPAR
jgi:amino acid efflux transporter